MTYLKTILLTGLIGAATVSLNACNTAPPKHMMDIQAGEVFTLKKPLTIRADSARSYIQHGQATGGGFDHYDQHCRLEVRTLSDQVKIIKPDQFTITRVSLGAEEIASRNATRLYAGLQPLFVGSARAEDTDSQPSPTMDYVHLYLQSKQQPDVLRLTCAGSLSDGDLADAPRSYRPKREQINQILGKIGSISTE
ncbi:hypothetical protein [Thiomicrorhabdus xiamenensis]|uniref:Lipoprotein n=1 Tax=Thiomicrorhabdus xiamenensis TaxID=2739063 RepID=A0A7D4SIY2_9GAMM|nr:hypothetical protein [Thiomicrorhabdus xiamenensis]QKI90220.1 hypothetical protein HQN79_11870 [Thiomicrorhabdus xiamenensis]